MEDEKTYPDIEKINVDIKTCPIKPMDSCPLLIAAIVEMTPKKQTSCIIKGFVIVQTGLK